MLGSTQDGLTQAQINRDCWSPAQEEAMQGMVMARRSQIESGPDQALALLVSTIESEIIPRLMLVHRSGVNDAPVPQLVDGLIAEIHVLELAQLVLRAESPTISAYVSRIRTAGVSLESLYLDLLAPTARHLGDLWDDDQCDFSEVTLALWRLQQIVYQHSPSFGTEANGCTGGRRILLASVPGEQHSLGLLMVTEFFRRAGWDVHAESPISSADLPGLVASDWFDVAGLSTGSECRLDVLAGSIREIRRASRNRMIRVMVGGPLFVIHPEYMMTVGADATAADAQQAVIQAENLIPDRAVSV